MNYTFKRTYLLSQQTPLIHFQYDQEGATLRASEVKPKLDAYILKKKAKKGETIPDDWFMRDKKGLNYRMTISAKNVKIEPIGRGTRFDIYYGDKDKQGVLSDGIELKIVCRISKLLDCIDLLIQDFFITHNFGTMQRKGFGSFLVTDVNGNAIPEPNAGRIAMLLCGEYSSMYCYKLQSDKNNTFKRIKALYGLMKSGYNYGDICKKSLLFQFFHREDANIPNEKHGIKSYRIAPKVYKPRNITEVYEIKHQYAFNNTIAFYYVRALLGLGDHIVFNGLSEDRVGKNPNEYCIVLSDGSVNKRTAYRDRLFEEDENDRPTNGIMVSITSVDSEIKRLKSPVFFKIINQTIYFVGEPINREIIGKKFKFSSYWDDNIGRSTKQRNVLRNVVSCNFTVPNEEQLQPFGGSKNLIDNFLDYVFNNYGSIQNIIDPRENEKLLQYSAKGVLMHEQP